MRDISFISQIPPYSIMVKSLFYDNQIQYHVSESDEKTSWTVDEYIFRLPEIRQTRRTCPANFENVQRRAHRSPDKMSNKEKIDLCSQVILSLEMSGESLKCPAKNLRFAGHFVRRVTKSFRKACILNDINKSIRMLQIPLSAWRVRLCGECRSSVCRVQPSAAQLSAALNGTRQTTITGWALGGIGSAAIVWRLTMHADTLFMTKPLLYTLFTTELLGFAGRLCSVCGVPLFPNKNHNTYWSHNQTN